MPLPLPGHPIQEGRNIAEKFEAKNLHLVQEENFGVKHQIVDVHMGKTVIDVFSRPLIPSNL